MKHRTMGPLVNERRKALLVRYLKMKTAGRTNPSLNLWTDLEGKRPHGFQRRLCMRYRAHQ